MPVALQFVTHSNPTFVPYRTEIKWSRAVVYPKN